MDQKVGMKPPTQEQQQQQVGVLQKCPRCESTNTKFCYFNNYSLTQPRHFCKACKRYWTKGGTLRNVPVGGGCRKKKRIKRPSTCTTTITVSSPIHNVLDPKRSFSCSTIATNPMFYGFPITNNPSSNDLNNLQFHGYDLDHHHHQYEMSGGGLGSEFSSSGVVLNDDYRDGYAPNPLLSNYGSMFGSSSPSTTTANPTMASIIASSLQQQQKFMQQGGGGGINGVSNLHFKSLFPFENMQIATSSSNNNGESGGEMNGVKVEGGQQSMYNWSHDQIQQIGSSSDHNINPSIYTWNSNTTNWPDLTNIGSSVTSSLI